eukprot:CAMPEP_0175770438 /NCGR_PEP_ID=MMETSP0097-20121207/71500_1 /TAXON_ID=311494 /ORGANISM="Alexandrium monilatum, Strain CCMP3105" /LENGTH=46 /DNA_ID= /DNA_START= /DNA_END= /DNA_ORIENTATION=
MDVLALVRHIADAVGIVLEHLRVGDDIIEGPLVLLVLAGDLLPHAG